MLGHSLLHHISDDVYQVCLAPGMTVAISSALLGGLIACLRGAHIAPGRGPTGDPVRNDGLRWSLRFFSRIFKEGTQGGRWIGDHSWNQAGRS